LFKKIASNTISQILSKFLTAFISIFLLGILTKYLSVEMYGIYNKIYNYLGIFAFLADLGLYTITIREITENKDKAPSILGNVLTLRFLMGIAIMVFALILAFFLPGYNSLLTLWGIAIVSLFTIVSLLNSALMALMQSYMQIEFSLFSTVLGKLLNIFLIAGIVFFVFPSTSASFIPPNQAFYSILIAGLLGIILNT